MKNVVIAGYARSPFHFANKGELARVRPDELAAQRWPVLVERTRLDPADIEDLIVGCAMPEGEQGLNVARLIGFLAHLPISVAGTTVNRFCGSSMQAIHMAAGAIQLGAGEAFICAGVESMTPRAHDGLQSRCPIPASPRNTRRLYLHGRHRRERRRANTRSRARSRRPSRVASQQQGRRRRKPRASSPARSSPSRHDGKLVEKDGCIRPDTSAEGLAGLQARLRRARHGHGRAPPRR